MANEKVINLTSENFDETVKSGSAVLVDFWAPWCGPCRAIGPVIEELATELDGKAKVAKINVDEQGELAMRFRVMSIPTIMVFKNGEIIEKLVGARSKQELLDMVEKHI